MPAELMKLDATAQAALVRSGQVSRIELVEAAIEGIERLNPLLNAVITPLFEQAQQQAISPNTANGLFQGVSPFTQGLSLSDGRRPLLCRDAVFA
jgi:amidase